MDTDESEMRRNVLKTFENKMSTSSTIFRRCARICSKFAKGRKRDTMFFIFARGNTQRGGGGRGGAGPQRQGCGPRRRRPNFGGLVLGGGGSFSAVSKPNFASKYAFESSRDLHNALLCTAL